MYPLVDLTNRNILIAGASSGIGRQTAITVSRLGAKAVLIARRGQELRETIEELEGEGHSYYCADLANLDGIADLIKMIVDERGKLDGLVYAAGTGGSVPLTGLTPNKLQSTFNINFFAFSECVRQISRKGRYNEGMSIVGISSIAAMCGDKVHTAYSSSKAAMDGAVRCMAKELSVKMIRCNTVAPAWVHTRMLDDYIARNGEDNSSWQQDQRRQYLGMIDPQGVADAIAYLLSPAARFITGITLPVDGGYTSA